ncbi:MAG: hypothetical protein AAFX54_18660 [Pseudomonadota bacterium]
MRNTPASQEQSDIAAEVRINVAFEQMVLSVLTGAFVGGAATLLFGLITSLATGAFSISVILSVLLNTLLVSFLIFLVGFFASLVIGAPLFSALERAKRRTLWPYLGVALGVALIVLSFMQGGLPLVEDFSIGLILAVVLPAIVIAVTFARFMQPHWRAAERAEAAEDNILRLH